MGGKVLEQFDYTFYDILIRKLFTKDFILISLNLDSDLSEIRIMRWSYIKDTSTMCFRNFPLILDSLYSHNNLLWVFNLLSITCHLIFFYRTLVMCILKYLLKNIKIRKKSRAHRKIKTNSRKSPMIILYINQCSNF